jgi:hypothetical protein
MDWKNTFEIVYYIAGTIGALGIFGAAVFAVYYYYQNSQLERAKWASGLYEKFYEEKHLKPIRDKLDVEAANSEYVRELVNDESTNFTDYLNFFEFIAFLRKSKATRDGSGRGSLRFLPRLFGKALRGRRL